MNTRLPLMFLVTSGCLVSQPGMIGPRYDSGGQLIRPEGYREWTFVGSNLGMGYEGSENSPAPVPPAARFHNIYVQPEAYRHFAAKGVFPDKTILVMEVLSAGSTGSINRQGRFADRRIGIEAAVKDVERHPEKWAYYSFIGSGETQLTRARPFPKAACWQCHNEHAAVDNVFVQFYPVLRDVWRSRRTK